MDTDIDRRAKSVREQARSAFLVIWMATLTAALRTAMWAANEITLLYLYGRATVAHNHLRIVRVKPQLVVSNGDVLRGFGFYHYLIGVAIWLPLGIGLLFFIYYTLLPQQARAVWKGKEQKDQSFSGLALLWALALFFLVTGLLPMASALAVAAVSVAAALIWAHRIEYDSDGLQ